MKREFQRLAIGVLVFALVAPFGAFTGAQASVQQTSAYSRGYKNGYSDGYRAGKSDFTNQLSSNYGDHLLYQEADRGYATRFGLRTEYQSGYRFGFELGYSDGYAGRAYQSKMPTNTARSGSRSPSIASPYESVQSLIPSGTALRIRLETRLTTESSIEGDGFSARVLEPVEYENAVIRGHVAKINRSGTLTGQTEMALDFDTIMLSDGRLAALHAQIEKIYATDSVKAVDEEGNIELASKTTETELRSIGGAVLGAIIGGIATGGTGAAVGAILGAGIGAGSVYVQGTRNLILEPGVQMVARVTASQRERAAR